ncbi:TonB-dependent receptor plug domain-containing protein [Luteimonas sp. TWI1416]|uniref:TonB-dependent receptor plug domain-containing protein n=1 Tax=unclassified Luteimonas TaxID=2629088 RepID=UPI00320964BE
MSNRAVSARRHRLSVALASAVCCATSMSATAQDTTSAPATSPATLDAVIVTGTRIRSQTMTAASPVAEIQAEEFRYTGATKVEDLVNQYPQLGFTSGFDNFQNNPSQGYATASLRDLGAQRTLSLVNGRRIPKGLGETPDLSIIPSALVRRVDVLSGGASAVYGSDAVAGVVNFVLDDDFEGVNVNVGYSAFQHKNDNHYMRGLMDKVGYDYPTGGSGFDGISQNIDLSIGGRFGEGGHAIAWATWRENKALLQGDRDYSSCALNDAGTACGGSSGADPANFTVLAPSLPGGNTQAHLGPDSVWTPGFGALYNYAPVNYYQRPDTRYTAGTRIKYQINEHVQPYLEAMFVNRRSATQIAPSGTFNTDVDVACDNGIIGTLCSDLGITDDAITVLVNKRNVEGGPRATNQETTSYRITAGLGGAINEDWTYDASFTYNRSSVKDESVNDFVTDRVRSALLGCPPGSFSGCTFYNVWQDAVTKEAAEALQGVGLVNYVTSMKVFNAYASGSLGVGLPWANQPISLVLGYERRQETYERTPDSNMATNNFTGLGGPTTAVAGDLTVDEFFLESALPLLSDAGSLDGLDLELGYRYSDYSTSGGVNTWKAGLGAKFADGRFLLRTGWNRAIRAAGITELYENQSIGLWGGSDPCAGSAPTWTAEQCALTGVAPSQYGFVPDNPAGQYNLLGGGSLNLDPETADTWTIGFAAAPIEGLNLSLDYYRIELKDAITSIGPSVILDLCARGQSEMCGLVRRNPRTGDLWLGSDPESSGLVVDTLGNFGSFDFSGIDLTASYAWPVGPGRLTTSLVGTYLLEQTKQPVAEDASTAYDCAGRVNEACNAPEWRHVASARYAFDRYGVGLRWRYVGGLDYVNNDGTPGTTDKLLVNRGNRVGSYNYIDLSGSVELWDVATWTVGVNNVFDKEPPLVGGTLVLNGNSLGGYDQAGRFFFTSLSFRF